MTQHQVAEGESIEIAIKKFRKKCEREGIGRELKRRAFHEKPSLRKKRKLEAMRRKILKKQRKQARIMSYH